MDDDGGQQYWQELGQWEEYLNYQEYLKEQQNEHL